LKGHTLGGGHTQHIGPVPGRVTFIVRQVTARLTDRCCEILHESCHFLFLFLCDRSGMFPSQ